MRELTYRELEIAEAPLLKAIDRSEVIEGVYRVDDGGLKLDSKRWEVPTWSGVELTEYIDRLAALIDSGGMVFSAWDQKNLVGIGSLDTSGVGGSPKLLKLDMLYVSAAHRGQGVGRALTELTVEHARSLGATDLYISATPTKQTVDAYLRMGATLLETPDPELLAREPEDIHLSLKLA